jgi:hypothetical protein
MATLPPAPTLHWAFPFKAMFPPNPPLNSDPACTAFRSFSSSRFLGSAQRLGAGGAGLLHSLGPTQH